MQEEQEQPPRLAMAIPPGAASPRAADRQQHQQQQQTPSQPIPIPISIPASINNNNSSSSSDNNSGNNNGGGGGVGGEVGGGISGVLLPPPSPGGATLAARSTLFPFLRPVLSPRRAPYSQWTPPSSPAQWRIGSPPPSPGGNLLSSSPYSYSSSSSFPSSSSSYSSTSSSSSSPLRCAVEVFSFDRSCDGAAGAVAGFVGVGVAGPGSSGSSSSPPRPRGCDKCTQTGGEMQPVAAAAAAAAATGRRPPQHSATAPGSLRQALHSDSEASLGGESIPDVIPPRERSLSESAINPRMERVGQELRRIGDEFNVFVDGQQLQRRNFGRQRQNGRLLHDEAAWLLRFGLYIINRRNL